MIAVSAVSLRAASGDDLPGVLSCDDVASTDQARCRALESWIRLDQCLVAPCDGPIEGFIVLEYGFFGQGFIPLVCVHRERRRQGVGLRLMAGAERYCRTAKLFTSTNSSNIPARRLFERAGFVPSGTIENLDADDPELVYFKRCAVG